MGSHPLRITFRKYDRLNINFFLNNNEVIYRARTSDEMTWDATLPTEQFTNIYVSGEEYKYVAEGDPSTAFLAGGFPFYFTKSSTFNSYLFETIMSSYFITSSVNFVLTCLIRQVL
jgi:hypothetical protein